MASGGLIPYLIFANQDRFPEIRDIISNWFTPEAMRDAEQCSWNETTRTVENHMDKTCTDLDDDPLVNQFDFDIPEDFLKTRGFDFSTEETPTPVAVTTSKKKKWIKPSTDGDNDSLSTFQPNKKAKKAQLPAQPPLPANQAGGTTNPTVAPPAQPNNKINQVSGDGVNQADDDDGLGARHERAALEVRAGVDEDLM